MKSKRSRRIRRAVPRRRASTSSANWSGCSRTPIHRMAHDLDVPPSTLSSHLAILQRAGLAASERRGRVFYRADVGWRARAGRVPGQGLLPRPSGALRSAAEGGAAGPAPDRPTDRMNGDRAMSDRVFNVLFLAPAIPPDHPGRGDHEPGRRGAFRGLRAGSQPAGTVHPYALALLEQLNYDAGAIRVQDLGRVRGAGRAANGFRLHGLRQRRQRGLPDLAGPADDRALGRAGSGRRRGHRGRERARLRRRLPHAATTASRIFVNLPIASLDRLSPAEAARRDRPRQPPQRPKRAERGIAPMACPCFRTLSDRLGRALHRRRHRARPSLPGVFQAIGAAGDRQGQPAGRRADLADDHPDAGEDRLRRAGARCASTGAASASRCSSTGR